MLPRQTKKDIATPLVSISCTTYNHEAYIRDCLDGFLMQKTNFLFEILIHDDASTDSTAQIIKEYETKFPDIIKPIYQTENQYSKGVVISPTFNWPRAKGKYIASCEGDDYWTDPYKLQKQVDILEDNEEYGLVHTNFDTFDCSTQKLTKSFIKHDTGMYLNDIEDLVISGKVIRTATIMFRTQLLETILEFFNVHANRKHVSGDYSLFSCVLHSSKIYFINESTVVYRLMINSASKKTDKKELFSFFKGTFIVSEDILVYFNLYDRLGQYFEESRDRALWRKSLQLDMKPEFFKYSFKMLVNFRFSFDDLRFVYHSLKNRLNLY